MTRAYELAVVLSPELTDAEVERLQHSIKTLITKHEGEVTEEDNWGRRPTAYKLAGHDEAYYVFYTVSLDAAQVFPLDQALKLTDDVIRHLITIKE